MNVDNELIKILEDAIDEVKQEILDKEDILNNIDCDMKDD